MVIPIKTTTALMSGNNVNLAKAKNVAAQLTATAKTTTKATIPAPSKGATTVLDMGNKVPVQATKPVPTVIDSQSTALTPRVNGSIVPNRTILPVPTGNVVFAETEAKPIIVPIPPAETEISTAREETTMGTIVDPTQPTIMQENPAQVEGGAEEQSSRHQAPAKETVEDKPTVEQPKTKVKTEEKNKNFSYIIVALAVIAVGYFIYKSKKK